MAGEAAGVGHVLSATVCAAQKVSRSANARKCSSLQNIARKNYSWIRFRSACAFATCEEDADAIVEDALGDGDALIRYGGCQIIGSAYVVPGTAVHPANSLRDVPGRPDDVRRCAVMSIGFGGSDNPERCVRVVQLLSESCNHAV